MISVEIPEPIVFEWDAGNQTKSLLKHGITTLETEQTFFNYNRIVRDITHSSKVELRYVMYGQTNDKKILFISFTIRNNRIRVISARPADKKERDIYEKAKEIT